MTFRKLLAAAALTMAVAACGFANRDEIANMQAQGAFNQALHAGYVKLADESAAEYDWDSQTYYLERKALPAAMGNEVLPDEIASRDLPADRVDLLTAARERLMAVLNGGGRDLPADRVDLLTAGRGRAPAETAEAQLGFDCWMEQQEENHQPDDIAACQKRFTAAIEAAESILGPRAAAPAPGMMKPKIDGIYMVYFGFNSADLSNDAMAKIAHAAADYRIEKPAVVKVEGHADRSGSDGYNAVLGKRRADAVADALVSMGVPRSAISVVSFGEQRPLNVTDDGVKSERNRRVEIRFE